MFFALSAIIMWSFCINMTSCNALLDEELLAVLDVDTTR